MPPSALALCASALLASSPAAAEESGWTATVLVNAADSGNLLAHQKRYGAAVPALAACAAQHAPAVPASAPGGWALWTVTEATTAPTAGLSSEGLLAPAPDGATVWGDEAKVLGAPLTACLEAALVAVPGAGAGKVYVSVELHRPTP